MLEKYFRGPYQSLLVDPLAKQIKNWSFLSPSHLTMASCFIGILSAIPISTGSIWKSLICLLFSGYLDTLDGTLARLKNQSSPLGSALDIISDRVVEFSVILALFLFHPETRGIYSLLMLGSILICVTSFLVVGIFTENTGQKSFHYSSGLIERAEAFLFFSLMILFPGIFPLITLLFSSLVLLTAALRIYHFIQYEHQKPNFSRLE